MSAITTHILDASAGVPANQVNVQLKFFQHDEYVLLDQKRTDADGRIKDFTLTDFKAGHYQLVFEILDYFQSKQVACFYPKVCIDFMVSDVNAHFHVPLLISPYSYTTYRGS